jgi:hypothetical protein
LYFRTDNLCVAKAIKNVKDRQVEDRQVVAFKAECCQILWQKNQEYDLHKFNYWLLVLFQIL